MCKKHSPLDFTTRTSDARYFSEDPHDQQLFPTIDQQGEERTVPVAAYQLDSAYDPPFEYPVKIVTPVIHQVADQPDNVPVKPPEFKK